MKQYVNMKVGVHTVYMKDGSGVFLKRGQSVELDEKLVDRVDVGITVKDAATPTKAKTTTEKAVD